MEPEKESMWKSQKLREKPGMKSQVYCTRKGTVAGVVVLVRTHASLFRGTTYPGVRASVMWGVERRGDSFPLQFSPHFCACFLDSSPFRWRGTGGKSGRLKSPYV